MSAMKRFAGRSFVFVLCALLAACASDPKPDRLTVAPVSFGALPSWGQDDAQGAFSAFMKSCDRLLLKRDFDMVGQGILSFAAAHWQDVCRSGQTFPANTPEASRRFFETYFAPLRAGNNGVTVGKFTGYYEPLLAGSRSYSPTYNVPVYGMPPDLQKGAPYYTRAEINAGALQGRSLEVAWVSDPVGLFFAEIQGSFQMRYEDGSSQRFGYAGKNGQAYLAIGRELVSMGELTLENVSMQSIREWLKNNPDKARMVMERNPSYVFFRPLETEGPVGAQQVVLTEGRSLAVDLRYVPLGMPVYLDTKAPATPMNAAMLLRRLVIAQDTGGAIKGPVRGDIFFGAGIEAEYLAGHMNGGGEYFLLVPKTAMGLIAREED